MQKTREKPEMVTDNPQMTDCDGLPVLDWRSFFLRDTYYNPSPIRHPSPDKEKREYSQVSRDATPAETPDAAADALTAFRDVVEAARRPDGLIPATREVVTAWRNAEAATGGLLTLRGEKRAPYAGRWRVSTASALYDRELATAHAHRLFADGEIEIDARDALLQSARAP